MNNTESKKNANMNTILNITFVDIKTPKVNYLLFVDNRLCKLKSLDIINNNAELIGVYDNVETQAKVTDIKELFIKFVSIHPKITHSVQHTCIATVLKSIKSFSDIIKQQADSVVLDIINNKIRFPLCGKVVPCYVFPKETDRVFITSEKVISDFELNNVNLRNATIEDVYRNNKNTIYTLHTDKGSIMCDRSDFRIIGKNDKKDLFYVL